MTKEHSPRAGQKFESEGFASPTLRQHSKRFVHTPKLVPTDPLFGQQWHLSNTGQTGGTVGEDANLTAAWDIALGTDVVIGIVDDGLQHTHPDLITNYRADLSFDFNDNDADPNPTSPFDGHGTSAAGVAAATGNNNTGVSGAAPNASLAGIRLIAGPVDDQTEALALSYKNQDIDIYSNSWGPFDDGQRLEGPGPLTRAALQDSVTNGRGGLGNIYVWAAGNGLQNGDNVNYDGYANSRYVIAVSAIDDKGKQSFYSEPGAAILVAAHSSSDLVGITTTDLVGSNGYAAGDYTNDFGGTSSATPLVAGVVALMLDANPNLSWRDVQHILAKTARKNDATDSDWTTNGAGYHINHKYGFGAIDAAAAVGLATTWTSVAAEVSDSANITVNAAIPDDNPTGVTSTLTIDESITVEKVEVVFDADHEFRGDLEVVLVSPEGTESILAEVHNDSGDDYNNWVFSSVRHWGELAVGDWTLKVSDEFEGDAGVWNSWQVNVYGTASNNSPTDVGDTLSSAKVINLNANQSIFTTNSTIGDNANIDPEKDVDLYQLEMQAGDRITANIDAVINGSELDSMIHVFNTNGKLVAFNDDGAGPDEDPFFVFDSYLSFTATKAGTYYIGVSSYGNSNYDPLVEGSGSGETTGDYTLEVKMIPVSTGPIYGTANDDEIIHTFGAVSIFAGAGNDIVDASESQGRNRIHGGSGDDELYASLNDRLFGEAGNDVLDASSGSGSNRLKGGDGNDTLFGGNGDRLNGGNGQDVLYAGSDNVLTGGQDADQFWVANGSLPTTAHIVNDFELEADVIGIGGLELSFNDLFLSEKDNGTLISSSEGDIAFLKNIQVGALTNTHFVFA
jgi:subtilisin-like proprotein convertase family protein